MAEAPRTLWQALSAPENRGVALHFASFSGALAVVPVVGLLLAERAMRGWVSRENERWSLAAVVAVLLVQLVLGAFVLHCFREGWEVGEGDKGDKGDKGEKGDMKQEKEKEEGEKKGDVEEKEAQDVNGTEKDSKKEK